MKKKLPKILAHRGYSQKFPENTILAFNKAFENNADGIECDLQKSKDNKFVIIHDDKIDRVSDKTGKVNKLTLKELKSCTLDKKEKILELSELLNSIPENKFVNIELKKETLKVEDCPEILKIVLKHFKKGNLLISSFSEKLLYYFKKNNITTGLLIEKKYKESGSMKLLKIFLKLKPDFINLPIIMFKELGIFTSYMLIFLLKIFRRKLLFWVVNNEKDLKRIIKFSEIIITDNPEIIYRMIRMNFK